MPAEPAQELPRRAGTRSFRAEPAPELPHRAGTRSFHAEPAPELPHRAGTRATPQSRHQSYPTGLACSCTSLRLRQFAACRLTGSPCILCRLFHRITEATDSTGQAITQAGACGNNGNYSVEYFTTGFCIIVFLSNRVFFVHAVLRLPIEYGLYLYCLHSEAFFSQQANWRSPFLPVPDSSPWQ